MGKTTLTQRLHTLAQKDAAFRGKVNILFLDWEQEQKLTVDLQVGHDNIAPDTVLRVLHKALVKAGWGKQFGEYETALKELAAAEEKVNSAMQGQPDNTLPDQVSRLGAKGIAYLIRLHVGLTAVPQEPLETALDSTFKVSAEGLHQTRMFVQRALTPQEYELYEQPNERLAEALGTGLKRVSQRQPLVLLFDTYEIVDRPECDYTLRRVMETSGDQILWTIAGRSNLADSGQRGRVYFRGYKRDFAEGQLYDRALSEFGLDLIQQYFAQVTPDRPITEAQADAVARFSLGIPFVIRQAAVMWREGKPIEEIVAPTATPALGSGLSAYDQVIKTTSERFLVHCFEAPGREADLEAIYAMALMRRPDAELLRQMLDETDLEGRLQQIKQRYAFIWVEQVRLDEKLTQFLRAYLLADVRRTSQQVQALNDRAIAWLQLQSEAKAQGIADTAEQLRETELAELWLDLAHHQFWRSEETGMRYLVPHFVTGRQYNRRWAQSLLAVAEPFCLCCTQDNQQRLDRFGRVMAAYPEVDDVAAVLADLEKLWQRGWLNGGNPAEYETILVLQKGHLAYHQGQYTAALDAYLTAKKQLPTTSAQLREDLAQGFYQVSGRFIWPDDRDDAVYSADGETAIEHALALHNQQGDYHYRFAAVCYRSGKLDEAIAAYQQAITLDPKDAYPHNGLGIVYRALGRYDEAIAAYQQAITLDPKDAYPHNGLGIVYRALGRYDEAIAAYQQAITLDPKDAYPHNGLGIVYSDQGRYDEAIAAYQQAITLDPKDAYPHNGLGIVYSDQGRYDEAIAAYQQAITLDPKYAYPHNGLGIVYRALGRYDEAIAAYQQAITLDPKYAPPHNGLGNVYRALGRYDEAIAAYQQAITLDPKYAPPHNGLGIVYSDQGRYDEAIAAYQQAITLDPKDAPPHNGLGIVYSDQGRYDEAIAAYQQAITLDPKDAPPHNGLGIVYRALGRYDEAIAAYQQALTLDPKDAPPHNGLGIVYRALGRYDEAIAACQRAIALTPQNTDFQGSLASVYYYQGRYKEAIDVCQRAVTLNPKESTLYIAIGYIQCIQGCCSEAIKACQQAIKLNPKFGYSYQVLGVVYLKQDKFSEAESAFVTALDLIAKKSKECYEFLFWLGLAQALQGKSDAALENWQKSLSLATDTFPQAQLERRLIQLALASSPTVMADLAATIKQVHSSKGLLRESLETAQLLARCPQPPADMEAAISLLQTALMPPNS
jgi:tetratricopeptide (TPR) repeat protein